MSYSVVDKYDLLVRRLGFQTARKLLSAQFGFSAQGVDPFRDKIVEAMTTDATIEQKLDGIWDEVIFGGDRLIKVFKEVSQAKFNRIRSHFSSLTPQNHVYVSNFPFPVTQDQLDACVSNLVFCDFSTIASDSNRVIECAVICNKAYYSKTEKLSRNQLSPSGLALMTEGAEMFCRKRISTQCFHTIIFDNVNRNIYITVDVSALPNTEANYEFAKLRKYIRDVIGVQLVDVENLFPTISPLYNETDGGRIHSISFVTDDNNSDTIKLPSLASPGCIKSDNYHRAGEIAASTLSKYRITKIWDLHDATIGAELNGRRAMLYTVGPLELLKVHNCTKLKDNIFVIDKILAHI